MESRTIDLAKTASIDMMTLNNKVVNMRHVVKRAKVQVISKLCRHIHKLKLKQGTEEHKAKNIRKAQRLIGEIDSMRKLKEDNISKYALANTTSFADLSKMSLLPGPRALARLADHPLMKTVVADFRNQHSDWPDLAAYLLVKQTGRRFKTKKQKQKKLARCVENMNACETMTKVYIQERFGQEGLVKAEQTFERKRKRPRSVAGVKSAISEHKDGGSQKPEKRISEASAAEDLIENKKHQQKMSKNNAQIIIAPSENENQKMDILDRSQLTEGKQQNPHDLCDDSDRSSSDKDSSDKYSSDSETANGPREIANGQIARDVVEISSSDIKHSPPIKHYKASSECVVKELRLQNTHDIVLCSEDDEDNEKYKKFKNRHIPDFLTRANKTMISDPFFAGSDNDEEAEGLENKITADADTSDYNNADVDTGSGRGQAKSMFYNPAHEAGGKGGCDRRGAASKFYTGHRGSALTHGNRGGTFGGDYRGRTYKGRTFREHHDKGNRGAGFTYQHNVVKRDWRGGRRSTGTHTIVKGSIGASAADFQTSHTFFKATQIPTEKLHPSWEASKKRRAEQSGITAFQGSKLTFNDDD